MQASAPLEATANAVTVYPAEFFAPSAPSTAFDIVRLIPGFTFDRGDQVRGFVGTASNVLIDGVRPASKTDGLDDILRRTPATDVLRVEVIRGGAPGIDMQGKTVIANLILKRHTAPSATVTASTTRDSHDRYHGVVRSIVDWSVGQVSFEATGQIARYFDDGAGSGFKVRTDGSGQRILTGAVDQYGTANDDRGELSAEFPLGPGALHLSVGYSAQPQTYHAATSTLLTLPAGTQNEDLHLSGQTVEFSSRYEGVLAHGAALELIAIQQLSRSHTSDDFEEPSAAAAITGDDSSDLFWESERRSESILSAKLRAPLSSRIALNTGAEFDYNWLGAATAYIENGAPQDLPAANVHVAEARGEGYALGVWQPNSRVNVEGGLRLEASRLSSTGDVISQQSFYYLKPRLAVTLTPDSADQIRLRVEREVTQLDFNDFAATQGYISQGDVRAGNPRLVPQSDYVFEAALERKFWSSADVSVTGRHYIISNVIDRAPVHDPVSGDFDEPANIGSGRRDEVVVTATVPLDAVGLPRATLTGVTTFRWSHVIDPTTGEARTISGVRSNEWEAHFTHGLPGLRATWGLDAYGPIQQLYYRFSEVDTAKRGSNLTIWSEWKPTSTLALRIDVKNLLNHKNEQGRELWTDYRGASPIAFNELQQLRAGRFISFRVIKTFD